MVTPPHATTHGCSLLDPEGLPTTLPEPRRVLGSHWVALRSCGHQRGALLSSMPVFLLSVGRSGCPLSAHIPQSLN